MSIKSGLYDIPQLESNGLTAIDLFCGAGVGAYGIKRAGYNILWAVDNDKDAVRTYNLNIGKPKINLLYFSLYCINNSHIRKKCQKSKSRENLNSDDK